MERMWWEGRMVIDMSLRLGPYERLRDDHGALARLLRGGRRSRGRASRPTLRQLVFAPRPRSLRVRGTLPRRYPDHYRREQNIHYGSVAGVSTLDWGRANCREHTGEVRRKHLRRGSANNGY